MRRSARRAYVGGKAKSRLWRPTAKDYAKASHDVNFNSHDPIARPMPKAAEAYVQLTDNIDNLISRRDNDQLLPAQVKALEAKITKARAQAATAFAQLPAADQKILGPLNDANAARLDTIHNLEAANAINDRDGKRPTARQLAFEAEVKASGAKPFTDYAATAWARGDKAEFYAEAFMLYKTDPDFLLKNYPKIHAFFDTKHK